MMYQTSGSESWPRKGELTHAHSRKYDHCESLHITMKPELVLMKISLVAVIFISNGVS